ncbi:MAG TPA: hypothetical protein VFZ66_16350, partial [Herpetosiphonaceae bacterium]
MHGLNHYRSMRLLLGAALIGLAACSGGGSPGPSATVPTRVSGAVSSTTIVAEASATASATGTSA